MIILNIIIIILLASISYQDIKHREINWLLFPLLVIAFVIQACLRYPIIVYLRTCGINISLLIVQICLLTFYYLLKGRNFKSIINTSLGLGDLILLISMSFAFTTVNYILFYLTSLIFSLITWTFLKSFTLKNSKLIPLAGLISIYTIIIIIVDILSHHFDRLNDNYLIQLIYG